MKYDCLQSEHDNIKRFIYADDMAPIELLDVKSNTDLNNYFDDADNFVKKCKDANLIINADSDKTKGMIVTFSRAHSVCDSVIIDGELIDKADDFKYLGTCFRDKFEMIK